MCLENSGCYAVHNGHQCGQCVKIIQGQHLSVFLIRYAYDDFLKQQSSVVRSVSVYRLQNKACIGIEEIQPVSHLNIVSRFPVKPGQWNNKLKEGYIGVLLIYGMHSRSDTVC